ncbi:MAG: hypothetical protein D6734_10845 [Candidatus Schekmanbacteria bacterium]|nr:MAG: hypothetical protein D6734_10845 [Candidatus Schekmanbacteria bacterium]
MNQKITFQQHKLKPFLIGLFAYAFLLLSFLLSDSIFHHIGNSITADENPINFFTALNLWLASATAFLITKRHIKEHNESKYLLALWIIISLGLLYAGLDEMFEIHEAIGKHLEAMIQGTSYEIPFYRIFDEGEQPIMLCYFGGGIVMSYFFLSKMISSRMTAYFFISALILQGLAAISDSFNLVTALTGIYSEEINYTGYVEEISEFLSSLLFWAAMVIELKWFQISMEDMR